MPSSPRPRARPGSGAAPVRARADVPRGAVVVALDGGRGDHAALAWARERAAAVHRPVHLVHAVDDGMLAVADTSGTVVMVEDDRTEDRLAAARAHALSLAAELCPGAGATVVAGHVVTQLVAASRGAHLMVLGDSLLRAERGRPGQQIAVFVAMRARCPVVVVPGDGDPGRAPTAADGGVGGVDVSLPARGSAERTAVVVGVDGTHAGRGALDLAFAQASARAAQLKVVHVWPPSELGGAGGRVGWAERRAMVSTLLAGFRERYPDVLVVTHLIRGEPVASLVGRSWHADLLVLSGCYGEGRLGLLPGAVTLGVLEQARCPVAMVRDAGVGAHPRPLRSITAGAHAGPDEPGSLAER